MVVFQNEATTLGQIWSWYIHIMVSSAVANLGSNNFERQPRSILNTSHHVTIAVECTTNKLRWEDKIMDVSHVSVGLVEFLRSGVSNGGPLPNLPYCFLCFFEVPYESHIRRKVPFIRQQLKPQSNAWRGLGRRKFHKPKPILSAIMEVESYPIFQRKLIWTRELCSTEPWQEGYFFWEVMIYPTQTRQGISLAT